MFALTAACPGTAHALETQPSTLQYLHTSWTQKDGNALPAIQAIAQSPDGYIWLGSRQGLIRFDGVRFVPWTPREGEQLPSEDILVLLPSSLGGLWVGTGRGLCRLDRGHVIRYPLADRIIGGAVVAMQQDASKNLWILGMRDGQPLLAVLRVDGSAGIYGPAHGLPDARLRAIYQDSASRLWLGTDEGLCAWRPGSRAVCSGGAVSPISIVESGAGELLVIDKNSKKILRFRNGEFEPLGAALSNPVPPLRSLLVDRKGNIWIGTVGQGLLRVRDGRIESFTHSDGLSSALITSLLEDREGNLWVATTGGIDRFRDPEVTRLASRDGLSSDSVSSVCPTTGGSAWIGTIGGGLDRYFAGKVSAFGTSAELPSPTVLSLYADPAGRLWAGTTAGLAYSSGQRFIPVRGPDGAPMTQAFAIAGDPSGAVYVADSRAGLVAIRHGVAAPIALPDIGARVVYRLRATRDGELWVGFLQGGVLRLRPGESQIYTAAQGLAEGPLQAIYEDRRGAIWIGARNGISRFRDGIWTTWAAGQGLPDSIQSIVEDSAGDLWVLVETGLLRLPMSDLDQSPDGFPRALKFNRFGRSTGVILAQAAQMTGPHLARAADGRLWIPTEDGVAIVDPARIHGNPIAPAVIVEEMRLDGKPVDLQSGADPSFRGGELQITYTGVSMAAPEGVRFKYRLDGIDKEWHDAGSRRDVTYVNLAPGGFRFHVIAANSDGVWNAAGASIGFRVTPYFYQTGWFGIACAVVLAALVWGLHHLQVRRLELRFQMAAQERIRVTRELHDSLLQGFSGVVYQLEAAARQFDTNRSLSRRTLERAIDQADQALLETRRTLSNLRLPALENRSLPEALSDIGARLTLGTQTLFHLNVKGHVRQLGYDEQANVYLIGREAITNAVNHAGARRIVAQLTYSGAKVRLMVRDDGSGFNPQSMPPKTDHWGVAGMQERARQIGAGFVLESAAGQGTTVAVTVEERRRTAEPLRMLRLWRRRGTSSS